MNEPINKSSLKAIQNTQLAIDAHITSLIKKSNIIRDYKLLLMITEIQT